METYRTRVSKLAGTDYREIHKKARYFYERIRNRTKRRPYVRSAYFDKDKIFLDVFWSHLFGKPNWRDRVRRVKFLPPAIELIEHSRSEPESKENPNRSSEILHRFTGITPDQEIFYVQIKEDKRTSQKFLISIFPDQ